MQGVDVVIAGVGVIAVVATVLGVVLYDEIAGVEEITFEEITLDRTRTDSASGVTAQHDLTFDLPDNATAASGSVTVSFTGRAGQGGDVTFEAWFVGPNGTEGRREPGTISLASGAESGSASVDLPLFRWYDVPAPVNTTDEAAVDATVQWRDPLIIRVQITNPPDQLIGAPGGLITYTYDVEGEVDLRQFRIAPRDIPDPQAGQ